MTTIATPEVSTDKPFTIEIEGEEPRTYAQLGRAKDAANKLAARLKMDLEVSTIDPETGRKIVLHTATPVSGRRFAPWERVENNPKIDGKPVIKGWKVAYSRTKIKVLVYRPETKGAGWLVWDGRVDTYELCPNTTVAQKLTKDLKDHTLAGRPLETLLKESAKMLADAEKAKKS